MSIKMLFHAVASLVASLFCLFTVAHAMAISEAMQPQWNPSLGNTTAISEAMQPQRNPSLGNTTVTAQNSTLAPRFAGMWAQFCDDDNCSENCGTSVWTSNPDCLTQHHRRSIRLHGMFADYHHLAMSPGSSCDCQVQCEQVKFKGRHANVKLVPNVWPHEYCWNIAAHGYHQANSFRWLMRINCPANQCDWDGSPLASQFKLPGN